MIGSGLKKFAAENGLRVAKGVAYGNLRGFAATLSEGSGYKQIVITTKFADPNKLQELQAAVNQKNIAREYRVQRLDFGVDGIRIVFGDTLGTMKKIAAFVDWFFPMLHVYGVQGAELCGECGGQLTGGCWKLINGVAYHMHESCAEHVRGQIASDNESRKLESEGSYVTGLFGALLGAAIGAVVWALVLNAGYVASLVGLLIGWLAEKGYNLLKGKQSKGKVVILAVAVVLGVVMGTFAADVMTLVQLINETEGMMMTYGDIPQFLLMLLQEDAEYAAAVATNIGMGLLFAGLGVFALLRKTGAEVADQKFVDLD